MSHIARIKAEGNIIYLGRKKSREEARAAERAARDEYTRTGRVERARSVRRRPDHRTEERLCTDDAYLWYDSHFGHRRNDLRGEQRLMVGVLLDAIKALKDRNATVSNEAVRWFRDGGRGYLFSFATICDEFGIPVESARIDLLYGGREPR